MAYPEQLDFHRPSSTHSMDRKPATLFDDSEQMDAPTPVLGSTTMSPNFSPDTFGGWDDFTTEPFMGRPMQSNNPFYEATNVPLSNNNPYRASMQQTQNTWSVPDTPADGRTPTAAKPFDFPQEFNPAPAVSFMDMSGPPSQPFSLPMNGNVRPSAIFPPTGVDTARPMSPHSNKEWMEMSAQMDPLPAAKRMRHHSPTRAFTPNTVRRPDGVRKKNARFDIPAERSLINIDQLISGCNDPEQIKELKQQKRLLRNRQAALDSRQRKKKHTEELEQEKKAWDNRMIEMQEDLRRVQIHYEQEREALLNQNMELRHQVDVMTMDKEEMIRSHTLETGDLRKKVSVLTEKIEMGIPTAPNSAGLHDFATDMDNLNMADNWEDLTFLHDFGESRSEASHPQENALVVSHRPKEAASDEKALPPTLMLMLLLGAFVACKSSGNTQTPIPPMSNEIRAASAAVLDNALNKDALALAGQNQHLIASGTVEGMEPRPSVATWCKPAGSDGDFEMLGASSHFDSSFGNIGGPTKEQETEQLFSLTPAQYNNLHSMDFGSKQRVYSISSDDISPESLSPGSQPSHHRRNLAETLANMRERNKGESQADIYTRSLLWDKISPDVVEQFKRMVEESDRLASHPSPVDEGGKAE